MEATKLMSSVVEISDRPNHTPTRLPSDTGPNAEPRQSVAAVGQKLPPSAKTEAGGTASQKGTASQEGTASREDLNTAVSRLSDYIQSIQRTLDFSVDENSGRTVITVLDAKTERVIRQIPSEEALRMLGQIEAGSTDGWQDPQGFFVQEKV